MNSDDFEWCDYRGAVGNWCGLPALPGRSRCKNHVGLQQVVVKKKGPRFSGDSQHRVEEGHFQAKEGR